MRKIMGIVVAVAIALSGTALATTTGAGTAEAKIETGRYTGQYMEYGVIPTPLAHVRIMGKVYFQDYYGIGPRNATTMLLTSTPHGMVASYARDDASKWYYRIDFRKTRYGYKGVQYSMGIPMGDYILRKVRG